MEKYSIPKITRDEINDELLESNSIPFINPGIVENIEDLAVRMGILNLNNIDDIDFKIENLSDFTIPNLDIVLNNYKELKNKLEKDIETEEWKDILYRDGEKLVQLDEKLLNVEKAVGSVERLIKTRKDELNRNKDIKESLEKQIKYN